MNRGNVFSVLIIFLSCISIGQNNVWHTGSYITLTDAGWQESSFKVEFTSGVPIASSDGGSLGYYESVSVVTDVYGNERMYSDGIKIYDASHSLMYGAPSVLRGTQSGITGSSTQGALSVSDRKNPDVIHFFTANAIENSSGLRYHQIDLSRPGNAGNGTWPDPLGEVVSYDFLLAESCGEMLTSYGNCESDSVWVVGHASYSNDFIIILIDENGVSVKNQTLATPVQFQYGFSGRYGRGSLDFNHDGTQLAFTSQSPNGTHVINFDTKTGVLSSPKELLETGLSYHGYGVEFSPDGSKLYVTQNAANELVQFDLVNETSYVLNAPTASIETGNDGKLYVAKPSQNQSITLGVINNPNSAWNEGNGGSDYQTDGISFEPGLTNGAVSYALPQDNICYNTIITSTKTDFVPEEANLYPNPAKDYVFNSLGEEFVFYNYLGAEVFKSNETKINVSNLVDGVYFVKSQGAFARLVISK